jgi:hypothetical protein
VADAKAPHTNFHVEMDRARACDMTPEQLQKQYENSRSWPKTVVHSGKRITLPFLKVACPYNSY